MLKRAIFMFALGMLLFAFTLAIPIGVNASAITGSFTIHW